MKHQPEHCAERVEAAIEFYNNAPIYHALREAVGDRFLTNGSGECWVELSIAGADDTSFIFKVTADQIVIDQRGLSWWGYEVFPYPTIPYGY